MSSKTWLDFLTICKLLGSQFLLLYLLPLLWTYTGTRKKDAGRCQIPNHVYGKFCFKKAKRYISIAPEKMLKKKCLPYTSQFFSPTVVSPLSSLLSRTMSRFHEIHKAWYGKGGLSAEMEIPACLWNFWWHGLRRKKNQYSLKYTRKLQGVHSSLSVANRHQAYFIHKFLRSLMLYGNM